MPVGGGATIVKGESAPGTGGEASGGETAMVAGTTLHMRSVYSYRRALFPYTDPNLVPTSVDEAQTQGEFTVGEQKLSCIFSYRISDLLRVEPLSTKESIQNDALPLLTAG